MKNKTFYKIEYDYIIIKKNIRFIQANSEEQAKSKLSTYINTYTKKMKTADKVDFEIKKITIA